MATATDLIDTILASPAGLTLAELLARRPQVARRTAQRWLGQLIADGRITARGEARARRYWATVPTNLAVNEPGAASAVPGLSGMALSADSQDILAYVGQPLRARKPVGYQRDFLSRYQPNETAYLSEPLRRQLHRMGRTAQLNEAAGTHGRAILNRLLIDLSWASSHLEGNTYSRLDTRALIEHGRAAKGKGAIETQMILNHKAAIEMLVENIATVCFDRFTLMNLHSALAENLLPNPADEGRVRQHAVNIGLSVYRPLSVAGQIDSALDELLRKAAAIADPFEQSFFVMVHLPYLQPFADINKRTSRLAANLPLLKANLCPLTFLDVPEPAYTRAILGVYEMTRVELLRDLYVWAYERSTQEYLAVKQDLAEPDPMRLAWRDVIKQVIRDVVKQPAADPLPLIEQAVAARVPAAEQADVKALIVEELRRLHEGVLARYGLRPSELAAWKAGQRLGATP
jgi:fido (protein-threonine AMPylation protein)